MGRYPQFEGTVWPSFFYLLSTLLIRCIFLYLSFQIRLFQLPTPPNIGTGLDTKSQNAIKQQLVTTAVIIRWDSPPFAPKLLSFLCRLAVLWVLDGGWEGRSWERIKYCHCFWLADQRENSPVQSIRSPKRLLFGAMSEMISPSEKGSARIKRPSGNTLGSEIPTAYQV